MKKMYNLYKNSLSDKYSSHEISLMFRELVSKQLNIPEQSFYFLEDIDCKDDMQEILLDSLYKLKKGVPFQHILGYTEFHGLKIIVNKHVLTPRPETSELIEWIRSEETDVKKILDIGTGSGCIALALKKFYPKADIWAIDKSKEALDTAKENSDKTGLFINFKELDMLTELDEMDYDFNLIVSNPPYIMPSEKELMTKDVLEHEPHLALFVPEDDPLIYYRAVAEFAYKCKSIVYFEINPLLYTQTSDMLKKIGFCNVEIKEDISKKPRMIRAF